MKTIKLSGSPRANVGKTEAARLRDEAKIPCVLYGGEKQIHFWAHGYELKQILYSPETYKVEITIEQEVFFAIVQESQYHPVSDAILHVDFLEVNDQKPVKLAIPISYTGVAPGVRAGGKFTPMLRKMKVKGLISDMPDSLSVDISKLEMGKSIRVKEQQYAGLTILEAPNNPICSITVPRGLRGK